MVSKNEIKLLTSLSKKKYRYKHLLFVAEGKKLVSELIDSKFEVVQVFTTENQVSSFEEKHVKLISEKEMQKISALHSPSSLLGLFKIPKSKEIASNGLQLVLDDIKDPGNLGTIIRLCDWYGVSQIICSSNTVDCYNPKVVQASMGSIANVDITYTDLEPYLKTAELPKYFTLLEGKNIYKEKLPKEAILVLGNESKGIRNELYEFLDHKITIPKMSINTKAESLNVAMATAITLSEFKR